MKQYSKINSSESLRTVAHCICMDRLKMLVLRLGESNRVVKTIHQAENLIQISLSRCHNKAPSKK